MMVTKESSKVLNFRSQKYEISNSFNKRHVGLEVNF